jgi:hypothetical protein
VWAYFSQGITLTLEFLNITEEECYILKPRAYGKTLFPSSSGKFCLIK